MTDQHITESQDSAVSTKRPTETDTAGTQQGTGFWSTVKSVVGAMFGVQSEAQREKDFKQGSALQLILGGLVFTILFIMTILYFVNSALEGAGQ